VSLKVKTRRYLLGAVAVVACAAMTAACGSSAGGAMSLNVGINPGNLQDTFQFVAQQEGFYKKAGLSVSLQNIASAATEAQALQSGSLDVGALEISVFLNAPAAAKFMLVAGANASNPVLIGDPRIQTANAHKPFPAPLLDLKGKSIGVPVLGTGPQIVLTRMLKEAGMSPSDVKFVQVGNTSTALPAMQAGRVQAIYGTQSSLLQVRASGAKYYLLAQASEIKDVNLARAFFASLGVSTQSEIAKKPKAIKAYCTAIRQTITWMQDPANIAKVTADTQKWMGIGAAAAARKQISGALPAMVAKLSQSDWENAVKVFPNPSNLTYDKAVDPNC
jgi:NitT/TauT family transport system substrate-binding protein